MLDRRPPTGRGPWIEADFLTQDVRMPGGSVVLAAGASDPRPVRPWELVVDNALATARLLPELADKNVCLISSVEVYGRAGGPLTESTANDLPLSEAALERWCDRAHALAATPLDHVRAARLCRELADADPGGRWVYALAKRAQEILVSRAVPAERLSILRSANLFGSGQERVVSQLVGRALAGLELRVTDCIRTFLSVDDLARAVAAQAGRPGIGVVNAGAGRMRLTKLAEIVLDELNVDLPVAVVPPPADDTSGDIDVRRFLQIFGDAPSLDLERNLRAFVHELASVWPEPLYRPLPVVVPPRPESPETVFARQQQALLSGSVRDGQWTSELAGMLHSTLAIDEDHEVLVTSSGTAALKLAVVAAAGPGWEHGHDPVAVLPAFTFAATAEVLVDLGYRLRFCEVNESTWTLDSAALVAALAPGDVTLVVAVDALGAPADYDSLRPICAEAGVALIADSAPAMSALHSGRPLGNQADAHAFSMSFAKVVSAAGAGGALSVRRELLSRLDAPIDWRRSTRISEVHAIAALDLVFRLDELVARRDAVAHVYNTLLGTHPLVVPQQVRPGDRHGWTHWTARILDGHRARLSGRLPELGVGAKPYYAPALHRENWNERAEPCGPLTVTDALAEQALALPMSSELTPADAERVALRVLAALSEITRL